MALSDRSALVTGASSGIGRAIALKLAHLGARLVLLGRDEARLAQTAEAARREGVEAGTYGVDLANASDFGSLAVQVAEDHGEIDILVHSAGVIATGPLAASAVADLRHQLEVNVVGPYALTQAFLPALRRRKGRIVFINSRAGRYAFENIGQYCASKHALRAVADSLRQELHGEGVRIISVYPGKIATPMQQKLQEAAGNRYDPARFAQPEDVAEAVACALCMPGKTEMTDMVLRAEDDTAHG